MQHDNEPTRTTTRPFWLPPIPRVLQARIVTTETLGRTERTCAERELNNLDSDASASAPVH